LRRSATFQTDSLMLALTRELVQKESFKLVALYLRGIDIIGHEFYHDEFPAEFGRQSLPRKAEFHTIREYYRLIDDELAWLIAGLPSPLDVVIVSDHGMEALVETPPPMATFLMNSFLQQLGLTAIKDEYSLEWSKTKVFQSDYHMPGPERKLRLNLKGREPEGIVPAEDREREISELMRILREATVRRAGRTNESLPLFSSITPDPSGETELICRLNYDVQANDLITTPPLGKPVDTFLTHFLTHNSGQHDNAPAGILLMSGPSFRRGATLEHPTVTDVLPTMLTVLGIPLSRRLDGRVLKEGLAAGVRMPSPATVENYPRLWPISSDETPGGSEPPLPPSIEKQLRQDLRALGYLQ
jgi:predicted AlkP superfamily phosphohydrolase/phosphomutase